MRNLGACLPAAFCMLFYMHEPLHIMQVVQSSTLPSEQSGMQSCQADNQEDGRKDAGDRQHGCIVVQDVISQMLIRDPTKRLGAKAGAEEIKAHPFFKGINWALIRHAQPPYCPRGRGSSGIGAAAQAKKTTNMPANAGFVDF